MFDVKPPAWLPRRPKLNFITLHYLYIIGWALVGSIILYPIKNIAFVDALFFASGAATQSGLNTVDVNLLKTYQQVVLLLIPWVTNPITINMAVVYIRLYWFEKRFDTIVEQSKSLAMERRSMSRRKSETGDLERAERGVAGRTITVLMNSARRVGGMGPGGHAANTNENTTSGNPGLQEFRKNAANTTAGHRLFHRHGRKISDANHKLALSRSKPGTGDLTVTDGNNDNEYAIEDDDDIGPTQIVSASQSPNNNTYELNGILTTDGEITTPNGGHISFADPKMRKPKRKDSEVYMVPSPFDVENRGSVVARKIVHDDAEEDYTEEDKRDEMRRRMREPIGDGTDDDDDDDADDDEETVTESDVKGKKPELNGRDPSLPNGHGLPASRAGGITFEAPAIPPHLSPPAQAGLRPRARTWTPRDASGKNNDLPPVSPGSRSFTDAIRVRHRRRNSVKSEKTMDRLPYLSYMPTIGRNSQFNYGELTDEQKEELGGVEYRSLRTLAWILAGYFLFFQVFGMLCLIPWIHTQSKYGQIVNNAGQNKTWWAIFTSSSAFTDLGFTLTPDSMVSFNTATWPLLAMSYLIIIGNTGFPCMLRFIIWLLWKLCPKSWITKESLHFLLDHPRRCFTLLFPSRATWWLFAILIILNVTDVLLFIILDLNDADVMSIPLDYRILAAYFQAVSTRTAGFAVINLSLLHPGVQVSYLIMMYISVFPIAISVRRTNVYEERSLGIYGESDEDNGTDQSFVGAHLRKQLSFDLWYVFLGLFAISIAEGSRIANRNDYAFTQFSCLFEVISAYGTVGLSLGYPDVNTSFSGQFTTFSKIIIMAMMIRGRHRGLPYELDRAILLPSESLQHKEEVDVTLRLQRRATTLEKKAGVPLGSSTFPNGSFVSGSGLGLPPGLKGDGVIGGGMSRTTSRQGSVLSHRAGGAGAAGGEGGGGTTTGFQAPQST